MITAPSLIPELDDIVRHGDPARRADAARRISKLFFQGAASFRSDHVELFDGVLTSLVPHAEFPDRAELAERLSELANAPRGLVGQLAHEDEIAIAGPLLRRSPVIDEQMLIEIASEKSQGHLLAMAERPTLSSNLTDVIVARGDRNVVRRTAGNAGANFSPDGYSTLIKRAGQDGVLTIRLGQREDLSPDQLKDLLSGSHARAAGRDQAGDERHHRRHSTGGEPRLQGGAAHGAGAAPGRRARRGRIAQLRQGFQIRGVGRRAFGDDRRQDRNSRPPDQRRSP
jgi:uncharacterized protein (DUF2336 family)